MEDKSIEVLVMDSDFNRIAIIDNYISLIWTDRYNTYGDFELYFGNVLEMLNLLKKDYYLWIKYSEHMMVVEDFKVTSSLEEGDRLIVKGRSLESILDRRIVWNQTILTGNLQNAIKKLLNDAIISPTDPNRQISNFTFETSSDANITSLTISCQFTGTNLYDAIHSICDKYNLGFKITLDDNNNFVFSLYKGIDRSYSQSTNPYVVFSPNFDNLLTSDYEEVNNNLRSCAHIGGEGEGLERTYADVDYGPTGIERRELFVDARDISSDVEEGEEPMTEEEYAALLEERGYEKLEEYLIVQTFQASMDLSSSSFAFGTDFFMGDTVEVVDKYGIQASCRIYEMIISKDDTGFKMYPTFSSLEF